MDAFRIGRVQPPWANLSPPACNSFFRPYNKLSAGDSDDPVNTDCPVPILSSLIELEPETSKKVPDNATIERQPALLASTQPISDTSRDVKNRPFLEAPNKCCFKREEKGTILKSPTCVSGKSATRTKFIEALEKEEIHSNILAYPSLNIETQEAISREYSALHERIKHEGFYKCRYVEYGKDSIRWVILFSTFLYLLNVKWYLASAIFLGMFWVRSTHALATTERAWLTSYSNKLCSLLTMLGIEASLATSLPTAS